MYNISAIQGKMRTSFITFIALFLATGCNVNISNSRMMNNKYQAALEYMKQDSAVITFLKIGNPNLKIPVKMTVSPTILPAQISDFGGYAKQNKLEFTLDNRFFSYKNRITDSLFKYESEIYHDAYIDESLQNKITGPIGDGVVFFSKEYSNFLTADLIRTQKVHNITETPGFTQMLEFLFIFSSDTIKSVYFVEVDID